MTGGASSQVTLPRPEDFAEYGTLPPDLTPGPQATFTSGGTANILPEERKKATFEVEKLVDFLDGGEQKTRKKNWILSMNEKIDMREKHHMDRTQLMAIATKDFIDIHRKWAGYHPNRMEVAWMSMYTMNPSPLFPHFSLGLTTIITQASDEQREWWLLRCLKCEMVVCYAQTELGHGSNVRGIQTTATYDKGTQEWVLHTPTLHAVKWWNSGLGCVATHALVYAQMIIDGKEYGVHVFMLQVRDENHVPFQGVEVGDMGPKMGDAALDTGYLRLSHVRLPRKMLLTRYQEVTPEGQYVKGEAKSKGNDRLIYFTMMSARGSMVHTSGAYLARAATIATRFSLVRRQGFIGDSKVERQLIDYGVQRFRLFRNLALSYALQLNGQWMMTAIERATDDGNINPDALPEMHATTSGLKGLGCLLAAEGMEDLRKACGGNGYLLANGIGAHWADYVWQVTAEGDYVVLLLQTARFLWKMSQNAKAGKSLPPYCAYLSQYNAARAKNFAPDFAVPTTSSELRNLNNIFKLFENRALITVGTIAEQMERVMQEKEKTVGKGKAFDEAFNDCSPQWLQAATVHCMLFVLRNFAERVGQAEDPAVKAVLERLIFVLALADIVDGGRWVGIISRDFLGLARGTLTEILAELRPDASALVDAFEFPDRVLQSAIGREDGNIYEALFDAARRSPLNQNVPFAGYDLVLKPYLDMDFLKNGNKPPAKL